jgi:hypothetical protein
MFARQVALAGPGARDRLPDQYLRLFSQSISWARNHAYFTVRARVGRGRAGGIIGAARTTIPH